MLLTLMPNQRWLLNFVAGTFGASRKFRILAVIDDCSRESLCLIADTSISGAKGAPELDARVRIYGKPACIETSTAACAMNCWTRRSSTLWMTFAARSRFGATTTTPSVRTPCSAT